MLTLGVVTLKTLADGGGMGVGWLEVLTEHFVPGAEEVLWICPVNNCVSFSFLRGAGLEDSPKALLHKGSPKGSLSRALPPPASCCLLSLVCHRPS